MEQKPLWHDDIYDVARDMVNFLGGPKTVGLMIWPSKSMHEAQRYLLHCLDPDRSEKLALHELDFLIGECRKRGNHSFADYMGNKHSYRFEAVTAEEKRNSLMEIFNSKADELLTMAKEIKSLHK